MPAANSTLVSCILTLTSANTNYNIHSLVSAIDSGARGVYAGYRITSYDGIDGVGANTNDILLGGSSLSTTRFSDSIAPGEGIEEDSGDARNTVSVLNLYARSAGAGQKLIFKGWMA